MTIRPIRFEYHIGETRIHRQRGDIAFGLFNSAGDGTVDPLWRDEDSTAEAEQPAEMEMMLSEERVTVDRNEFIIEQNLVWSIGIHGPRYGKKRKFLRGGSGDLLFHMVHNEHRIADGIDGWGGKILIEPGDEPLRCGADSLRKCIVIGGRLQLLQEIVRSAAVEFLQRDTADAAGSGADLSGVLSGTDTAEFSIDIQ